MEGCRDSTVEQTRECLVGCGGSGKRDLSCFRGKEKRRKKEVLIHDGISETHFILFLMPPVNCHVGVGVKFTSSNFVFFDINEIPNSRLTKNEKNKYELDINKVFSSSFVHTL